MSFILKTWKVTAMEHRISMDLWRNEKLDSHGDKSPMDLFTSAEPMCMCTLKGKLFSGRCHHFSGLFLEVLLNQNPQVVHKQVGVALQLSVLWFLEIRPLFGRTVWANYCEPCAGHSTSWGHLVFLPVNSVFFTSHTHWLVPPCNRPVGTPKRPQGPRDT